jgi:hypothetical protein
MRRPLALLLLAPALASVARADEGEGAERRFTWRPSFETRSVYDSNAFLGDEDKDADYGVWMIPRLQLDYRTPAGSVGADLGAEIPRYFDHSKLNDTFWRMRGYGELGLWPGLSLHVSDALTPQPMLLGLPEDSPSNLAQANRAEAELRYWHELPGGRELTFGAGATRFDAEPIPTLVPGPGNLPVFDDDLRPSFTEENGYLEVRNPLRNEKHALVLRGQLRNRHFDAISEGDHLDAGGLLGFEGRLKDAIDVEIAGGAGWLDAKGVGSDVHALARANLGWRHERSGVFFRLGFHHQVTPDLVGKAFIDTTGRLQLERYFGLKTSATVTGFLSYLKSHAASPSTNQFGGVELAVRRQISRSFQITAAYRYWDNGGEFSVDDFQQHQASIGLSYVR